MRVLVLGGTGVFGSRLCRLLAADPAIALTIAARDRAAVDALAHELGVAGRAFDVGQVVVDQDGAAGPHSTALAGEIEDRRIRLGAADQA